MLLASRIQELRSQGYEYQDIVLLFRAMTYASIYANVFKKYHIPTYIVDDSGFFDHQEIQDLLCFLRTVEDREDQISLAAVLRGPFVGVSDETLFWMHREGGSLNQALEKLSLLTSLMPEQRKKLEEARTLIFNLRKNKDRYSITELIAEIREHTSFDIMLASYEEGVQKISRMEGFLEFVRNRKEAPLFKFLEEVSLLRDHDYRQPSQELLSFNGVRIMSVHKSKGLEFPAVFLPDIGYQSSKNLPLYFRSKLGVGLSLRGSDLKWQESYWKQMIKKKEKEKDYEESKRLFYVAVTRAKKYLHLSGSHEGSKSWLSILKKAALPLEDLQVQVEHVSSDSINPSVTPAPSSVVASAKRGSLAAARDKLRNLNITIAPDFPREKPELHYSVTALQEFQTCPFKFKNRYLEEIPEIFEKKSEASDIGTEVHSILENWDFAVIPGLTRNPEITALLKNLTSLPIFERMKTAQKIYKEYPFYYKWGSFMIEGIVDLIFQDAQGKWVILDYKTNNIKASEVQKYGKYYEFQTNTYAWILSELLYPIDEVILLFLRPQVCYEQSWSSQKEEMIQQKMKSLFESIKESKFQANVGDHCRYCGYQGFCEAYLQNKRQLRNILPSLENTRPSIS